MAWRGAGQAMPSAACRLAAPATAPPAGAWRRQMADSGRWQTRADSGAAGVREPGPGRKAPLPPLPPPPLPSPGGFPPSYRPASAAALPYHVGPPPFEPHTGPARDPGGPIESSPIRPIESSPIRPIESSPIRPIESSLIRPIESSLIRPVESSLISPIAGRSGRRSELSRMPATANNRTRALTDQAEPERSLIKPNPSAHCSNRTRALTD